MRAIALTQVSSLLRPQDGAARAYKMELEVRCGMCLGVCNDLLLLLCLHSFCGDCLRAAVAAAAGGELPCPICKVSVCGRARVGASLWVSVFV